MEQRKKEFPLTDAVMDFQTKQESYELIRNISKALNPLEKPLDYGLTRKIILATHRLRDGSFFWNIVRSQILTPDRFSAWKFCCLLHRLFRDGHYEIMIVAQQQRADLQQMRNYWAQAHSQLSCVGMPIGKYVQLLLIKLNFHRNYTFLGGDLHYSFPRKWELEECFQLALDILDYLESILELFHEIFKGIERENLRLTSCAAQCRLTSILTLISECGALYEHCVTALQFLTQSLTLTDVIGINNRFYGVFGLLQRWFIYFRSLDWDLEIGSIPELPETAPTFGIEFLCRQNSIPTAPFEHD